MKAWRGFRPISLVMSSNHCFRFTTVVWGTDFANAFLKVVLPSLLTPGNLIGFAANTDSRYRIYTTPRDAHGILRSKAYKRLSEIMPVELATVQRISYNGKYRSMTQCHADFIRSFGHESCAFFFISPDAIWADGAFDRLFEINRMGKRMVAVTTPRLSKETFIPAFLKQFGGEDETRPITPRQLVKLAMDHLHPITQSQFWNPEENIGTEPGDIFWKVDEGGFLARAFHLQPLMVRPVDRTVLPTTAVDADYTGKVCPDTSDIYVVKDSDELCYFDFTSSKDRKEFIMLGTQTVTELAKAAKVQTNEHHREFVKSKIRFHWTDLSEKWSEVEKRSDLVIEQILSSVERMSQTMSPAPKLPGARYFSPGFLRRKLQQKGVIGFCKQVNSKLVHPVIRKILGANIKIKMLADAGREALAKK